jgi:hypothetical protein
LHCELGIHLLPLPELRMLVIDLLKNRGLFKQQDGGGIKREVLKVMMERGYMPDQPIKTKKVKSKNSFHL